MSSLLKNVLTFLLVDCIFSIRISSIYKNTHRLRIFLQAQPCEQPVAQDRGQAFESQQMLCISLFFPTLLDGRCSNSASLDHFHGNSCDLEQSYYELWIVCFVFFQSTTYMCPSVRLSPAKPWLVLSLYRSIWDNPLNFIIYLHNVSSTDWNHETTSLLN